MARTHKPVRTEEFPLRFFYRDEYLTRAVEHGMRHVFDTGKPRRIFDALVSGMLIPPERFVAPDPLGPDDLALVHSPTYIDELQQPGRLARLLLLDPEEPWEDRLLEPFLYAAGGTLAGAQAAARERGTSINLGGGYHHAQADKAEGFCAIADVAIAIRWLQRAGLTERTLIIDLDYHHGNGNALIFADDESVFTFSMHAGNWCWVCKRNNLDVELPPGTGDEAYLGALARHLPPILAGFRPDFVFYVDGSDPYVGDFLGDFRLSERGMLERDRFVTEHVRRLGLPLVVVTAGGYGPESWRIHFNYFRWLLTGQDLTP